MVFNEHPSYGLAVMLALDVSGVLACEALAIELCARLRQCGAGEIDAKIHWLQGVETPQVAVRQWTMLGRIPHPPFAGYARTSFEEAVRGDVKSAETLQFKADVFDVLFRLYELGYGLDTIRRSGPVLFAPR